MEMNKKKLILAFFLILIGVVGRLFMIKFVMIPNFEIVTSLSLMGGAMLGGIFTFIIPLSIIALSDVYLGNASILIFTWSAFAVIGLFGWFLRKRKNLSPRFILEMTGLGVFSSLFFYLYTNFGWWLLSGMYEYNLNGFVYCYVMGIPFFKTNLLGNLFFVPFFTISALFVWKWSANFYLGFNKSKFKLLLSKNS